mgnify:CR=1 FL=1
MVLFQKRKFYSSGSYCRCSDRQGEQYLHRAVWVKEKGKIPKGHHIHHKDGDRLNNSIENLECVSASVHGRNHGLVAPHLRSPERIELLNRIRPLSHEWHNTKTGRKKLSECAKRLPMKEKVCAMCSTHFMSKVQIAKYCSKNCRRDGKNKGVRLRHKMKTS